MRESFAPSLSLLRPPLRPARAHVCLCVCVCVCVCCRRCVGGVGVRARAWRLVQVCVRAVFARQRPSAVTHDLLGAAPRVHSSCFHSRQGAARTQALAWSFAGCLTWCAAACACARAATKCTTRRERTRRQSRACDRRRLTARVWDRTQCWPPWSTRRSCNART